MKGGELEKVVAAVIADATAGREDQAWAKIESLLREARREVSVVLALIGIVAEGHLSTEKALAALAEIYQAHSQSQAVMGALGAALEQARDMDLLNAAPPEHPLFADAVDTLTDLLQTAQEREIEKELLQGLATAARMMARQKDDVVERSYQRLIAIEPKNSSYHYEFGLFLKTRGRFREGMVANQTAEVLSRTPSQACEWNLGICATGARQGAVALQVWKRLDQKIEMGRFELPDGRYPQCKVRLAQRPLAERSADSDDPGLEETIWIERLSPCHGIVRSVLYQDLGVDYGDVILFDGAPITYHTYGETKVPVFPHLATLVRSNYRLFDFAGTQESAQQIGKATDDLERDAIVYSHSENFISLCASCWRNADLDHHHEGTEEKHVVMGKIAAPPDLAPRELLRQLDSAMAKREPCRIYTPDLCEAAGLTERAAIERRRFEMIIGSSPEP